MTVLEFTGQNIDLSGIDDHTVRNLKIAKMGGVTKSLRGDIIIIINQAAYMPEGRTILSTGQMEHYKTKVNEKSSRITGTTPSIVTLEGHEIPIAVKKGLPYVSLRPGTDEEWKTLPQVVLTSPHEWDPSILDCDVKEDWFSKAPEPSGYYQESAYDENGNLKQPA